MKKLFTTLSLIVFISVAGFSQQFSGIPGSTIVQATTPYYALVPISATTSAGNPTTLTIPAPPAGYFNYICDLKLQIGNNNTGTAASNATTSSTNFNSFATKFSFVATNSGDSGIMQLVGPFSPALGCAKSNQAGIATTFVSATVTAGASSYYGAYYQAP